MIRKNDLVDQGCDFLLTQNLSTSVFTCYKKNQEQSLVSQVYSTLFYISWFNVYKNATCIHVLTLINSEQNIPK